MALEKTKHKQETVCDNETTLNLYQNYNYTIMHCVSSDIINSPFEHITWSLLLADVIVCDAEMWTPLSRLYRNYTFTV